MMTKEVMKQALDALQIYKTEKDGMVNKAIKALEEALKQEQDEPVAMRYDFDGYGYQYIDFGSGSNWQTREKGAEPLYTAPQPKQEQDEPVGWIDNKGNMICTKINESCKPLYTTPQTKEWVGLTDEDIEDCYIEELYLFAVALEAKLKKKNH